MDTRLCIKLAVLAAGLCLMSICTVGISVMSVDLGTEWMKIAIVSPGVPMEIVLNKESKRKTPVIVSFRDGVRDFSENAVQLSTRFPDIVYRNMLDLVGKKFDNPVVQLFQKRFPYFKLVKEEKRGTVQFKQDDTLYTPEELLAMILEQARSLAQISTGAQVIQDAVITVPAFFNQAERRAVKLAAELAGLKVLQLMSDNAAVALNYGIFRRKDFNSTMQYIMFYDMGAGSTVASIVGYQIVKIKDKGFAEDTPQLTVVGVGYDRTLGGLELTIRLRDHLAKKFNEQKLSPTDVFTNPRAMAKLLKEAERVKMVLSANADHMAQVEGLLDDKDFKYPMTRTEFENLSEDVFQRVKVPIETAVKAAALTMDDIDQVILVGAGTRVPRVQEEILKVVKKSELGKNLNTDEAAALGAVYQAAHLSQGFKVKKFVVKESVLFPIQVAFERELDPKEGTGVKRVNRMLFGSGNAYPQKKVMTFNRHVKDFDLFVSYGSIDFGQPFEKESFGALNISKISLSGVGDSLSKHEDDKSDYKGVKAHFKMDESGILNLDQVESVFETVVMESATPEDDSESTLGRLGSTISRLFASMGQGDLPTDDGVKTEEQQPEEILAGTEKQEEQQQEGQQSPPANDSQTTNATGDAAPSAAKNETKPVKAKKVDIKEKIAAQEVHLDLPELTKKKIKSLRERLDVFNDQERERFEKEEAHNALESFILETKDKLEQPEFKSATTEQEREVIREKLSEASDWLDEISAGTTSKVYKEKLTSLKSACWDMFDRAREHRDRPETLTVLKDMLNASEVFLGRARNASEEEQFFTEVELNTLEKLLTDTKKWYTEKEAEQAKTPLYKSPVLTVRNMEEKIAAIDREIKYLVNKARSAKPKPKPTVTESTKAKPNKTEGNDTVTLPSVEEASEAEEKNTLEEPDTIASDKPEKKAEKTSESTGENKTDDKANKYTTEDSPKDKDSSKSKGDDDDETAKAKSKKPKKSKISDDAEESHSEL